MKTCLFERNSQSPVATSPSRHVQMHKNKNSYRVVEHLGLSSALLTKYCAHTHVCISVCVYMQEGLSRRTLKRKKA